MDKHDISEMISVIMPAYNSAAYINRAIDSVLQQQVSWELIIIDDCSTDNLNQIIENYRQIPNIRCIKNETNLGAAASRNKGVMASRGAYIAFLDADDWWMPDKLKLQLELLKNSGAALCCTARELITNEGAATGRIIPVKERITYKMLLTHNSINCSSVLLARSTALEFPMAHEDAHEDYITWLSILKKYGYACGLNQPLLKYRLSKNSKSGSKFNSAIMTFKVYRYIGFGLWKSCIYFLSYIFHGIKKYR